MFHSDRIRMYASTLGHCLHFLHSAERFQGQGPHEGDGGGEAASAAPAGKFDSTRLTSKQTLQAQMAMSSGGGGGRGSRRGPPSTGGYKRDSSAMGGSGSPSKRGRYDGGSGGYGPGPSSYGGSSSGGFGGSRW